jgi:hypothetical protein
VVSPFTNADAQVDRGKVYVGILLPFALNFSPNGVSAPLPLGFVWQAPHDCFVSVANCAVAAAGREIINEVAPATTSTAAVLQVMTNHCFLGIFIIPRILYSYISWRPRTSMLGAHFVILRPAPWVVCAVSYTAPRSLAHVNSEDCSLMTGIRLYFSSETVA